MKRSQDAGRTWSSRLPVPDSWAASKRDSDDSSCCGRGWATPADRLVGALPGSAGSILGRRPELVRTEIGCDWGGIVVMSSVVQLNKPGRYLGMFHDDGRFFSDAGKRGPFTLYQTISEDGGLTWSFPSTILSREDVHLCEPGIVRSPDGMQLAALLRENSRRRNSFVIFSNDEGASWRRSSRIARGPDRRPAYGKVHTRWPIVHQFSRYDPRESHAR